ncbi:exosortase E/protease, VPEID-CTERM system [Roseovarius sp. S4756]|uniref:exosortase E/protease, VPEID-CTERM system n=1 Tax=Roseovarius maritimus TaxID=3342637 RepID=UPI00372B37E6
MSNDPVSGDDTFRAPCVPQMTARALLLPALFVGELIALALIFQLATPIECRLTGMEAACRGLRGAAISLICLAALLGIYLWAATPARRALGQMLSRPAQDARWLILHGAGATLMVLPLLILPQTAFNDAFAVVFAFLAVGGVIAAIGALFWLAPAQAWRDWMRGRARVLAMLVAGALLLPMLADAAGPLWYWQRLTEITFAGVAALLWLLGETPVGDPSTQILGVGGFVVAIADSCSGVEGFALITAFLALYAWLFRDMLRMGRFWAIIWPVALLLSWVLNVLRIAALIWIGAHVSPDLAVGGFHSFAGWLFFTALALVVLVTSSRLRWLHRAAGQERGTLLSGDEMAALILPFVIFMASGVVAQTFWTDPALAYPWQVAAMAAALWWMRRPLAAMVCAPSALSIGAGLAVGAIWLALADRGWVYPRARWGCAGSLGGAARDRHGTVRAHYRGGVLSRLRVGTARE